ncbi:MAG: imidazolonepropionase [Caldilineaceae bacterium]
MNVDLLIHSAAQLVTCASPSGPKRGADLADVGLIADGAVAIADGQIVAVGKTPGLLADYSATRRIDASGKAVCPGFVDCHTHLVYAGDRVHEFERRIGGASYMEIMAAGGGIVSTMKAIRAASLEQLVAASQARLATMLALGTTTAEVKTGYGLSPEAELKMLAAIAQLDQESPCDLVPTFLGAHTTPPEWKHDVDGYVQQVIETMLSQAATWYSQSHFADRSPFFVDVFCEDHAFSVEQARRILSAGQAQGLQAKLHVDQFNSLGGVEMALALEAVSVDHLEVTQPQDVERLAAAKTIAVVLPAVNFNLGLTQFAPARALIDQGAAVALATDMNPGSAPCLSLPLVMAIACRYQRLLPAEALNACTINAAHALGLGERIGSIEVGKQADLLILNTTDYRHLAYQLGGNLVEKVIKRGVSCL